MAPFSSSCGQSRKTIKAELFHYLGRNDTELLVLGRCEVSTLNKTHAPRLHNLTAAQAAAAAAGGGGGGARMLSQTVSRVFLSADWTPEELLHFQASRDGKALRRGQRGRDCGRRQGDRGNVEGYEESWEALLNYSSVACLFLRC